MVARGTVEEKIDEMIEDFAKKLDTWVVTAGEELYREILEVLDQYVIGQNRAKRVLSVAANGAALPALVTADAVGSAVGA